MDSFNRPPAMRIAMSLSTWLVMFVGIIVVRAETHPWANTLALTALFPAYLWYMAKNNIIGTLSLPAITATVIGATLFMTLLLEANSKSKFSKNLKKHLKEYGKTPVGTTYASLAVASSIGLGATLSYFVLGDNFIAI